jgi:hypothetical protein
MRMRPSFSSGWSIGALFAAAMFGAVAAWAQSAPTPTPTPPATTNVSVPPATPDPPPLKAEEIDALVAPIALYPDNLLAQVLIASTYPLEVAMATQWRMQNPNLQGEQLATALETQTWDASVKALVEVPTALDQMFQRLDWTQKLGDAFLAQQKEVMDSVQRLRQRAQSAGKLMSSDQQKVTTENQTIVIEQANPQTIYVPYYDPYYMYGGWPYAGYPPYYWPAPPGYAFGAGLVFGLGIAIAGGAWNNWVDWNGGNINVDINRDRFTNIDRSNIANRRDSANQRWQHNADHRLGTNYRDQATRERFGQGNAAQANARRDFRGFEGGQLGDRAGQLGDRGGQFGDLGGKQLGQRTGFERSGQARGFDGLGNGNATRDFSSRGGLSRQSMNASRGFSGGGARSFSGGGFRGGGGGGFRGGGGGRR